MENNNQNQVPHEQEQAQQTSQQQTQQGNSYVNNAVNFVQNTADHADEYDPADIQKNKGVSMLAYLGILFFVPLVACPDSKYGRFHANQGLVLLLFGIVVGVVLNILARIFLGIAGFSLGLLYTFSTIFSVIGFVFGIIMLAFIVFGMVNTYNGKAKELPVIGKIHIIK